MFVELRSDGAVSAAYLEEQYPGQAWLPASAEAMESFLMAQPRLGRDSRGRTCLLLSMHGPLPERRSSLAALPRRHRVIDAAPTEADLPRPEPKADRPEPGTHRRVHEQTSRLAQLGPGLAIRFICALYDQVQVEPLPWRYIADIAEEACIRRHDEFDLALERAAAEGWLIVEEGRSVKLTFAGARTVLRLRTPTSNAAALTAASHRPHL
jgi:hypothetical protein